MLEYFDVAAGFGDGFAPGEEAVFADVDAVDIAGVVEDVFDDVRLGDVVVRILRRFTFSTQGPR